MPFLYVALGFLGGYLLGRRTPCQAAEQVGQAQREASNVLHSVGQLSTTGALASIDDLKLRHGDAKNGVELIIKTHDWVGPRPLQRRA